MYVLGTHIRRVYDALVDRMLELFSTGEDPDELKLVCLKITILWDLLGDCQAIELGLV